MAQEYVHKVTVKGYGVTQTIELQRGITKVGRQAGADVYLDHDRVSRRHAEFHCTETGCEIVDVGSSNGTYVQDEKLDVDVPRLLQPGDTILIDPFQLVYERTAVIPPEPDPPPQPVPTVDPPKAPPQQPPPIPPIETQAEPDYGQLLPGLSFTESSYLQYLPDIYETQFMKQFLALFESILSPIEWNVDNFDLFLSPGTTPAGFLPWLANWFGLLFDDSWSEEQRRTMMAEAHWIYASRGTKRSLSRILEIYLRQPVVIDDPAERPLAHGSSQDRKTDAFVFEIHIPLAEKSVNRLLIEQLVSTHKPAHTSYKLSFAA